jgi:hypothetical protein
MEEIKEECQCGNGGSCTPHESQTEGVASVTTEEAGFAQQEQLFALLLALTPLAVFTFFGQIGLL